MSSGYERSEGCNSHVSNPQILGAQMDPRTVRWVQLGVVVAALALRLYLEHRRRPRWMERVQ